MFVVKSILRILVLLVNVIMLLLHLQSWFVNLCVRWLQWNLDNEEPRGGKMCSLYQVSFAYILLFLGRRIIFVIWRFVISSFHCTLLYILANSRVNHSLNPLHPPSLSNLIILPITLSTSLVKTQLQARRAFHSASYPFGLPDGCAWNPHSTFPACC